MALRRSSKKIVSQKRVSSRLHKRALAQTSRLRKPCKCRVVSRLTIAVRSSSTQNIESILLNPYFQLFKPSAPFLTSLRTSMKLLLLIILLLFLKKSCLPMQHPAEEQLPLFTVAESHRPLKKRYCSSEVLQRKFLIEKVLTRKVLTRKVLHFKSSLLQKIFTSKALHSELHAGYRPSRVPPMASIQTKSSRIK